MLLCLLVPPPCSQSRTMVTVPTLLGGAGGCCAQGGMGQDGDAEVTAEQQPPPEKSLFPGPGWKDVAEQHRAQRLAPRAWGAVGSSLPGTESHWRQRMSRAVQCQSCLPWGSWMQLHWSLPRSRGTRSVYLCAASVPGTAGSYFSRKILRTSSISFTRFGGGA